MPAPATLKSIRKDIRNFNILPSRLMLSKKHDIEKIQIHALKEKYFQIGALKAKIYC